MLSLLDILDGLHSTPQSSLDVTPQSLHRLHILNTWLRIAKTENFDLESKIIGKKTLDVRCGQGDMTAAFAAVLKSQGDETSRVIGINPARLDYGSPMAVEQAQADLLAHPFGTHLSFEPCTEYLPLLCQQSGTYSTAYMAHSLYYPESPSKLLQTFRTIREAGVQALLLAEWGLRISRPTALPHLQSVLLQSMLPLFEGEVKTVLSPETYLYLAQQAGWQLVGQQYLVPDTGLENGKRESNFVRQVVLNTKWDRRGRLRKWEGVNTDVQLMSVQAHADALEASIDALGGVDKVDCMEVWVAVFRPLQ